MKLLIIASAPPRPDGKGYQVRLYRQIQELSVNHELSLISFDNEEGRVSSDFLRGVCKSIRLVGLARLEMLAGAARHWRRLPGTVAAYQTRRMALAVDQVCRSDAFDVAHVQLIRMAPYGRFLGKTPKVLDFIDALSVNMLERASNAPRAVRWAFRAEARRLRRYELAQLKEFDGSLVISERERIGMGRNRIVVNPNGVSIPATEYKSERAGIVLSGNMNYFANQDAAWWFAESILPLIRASCPAVTLTIVGRKPTAAILKLSRIPNLVVTGEVASLVPYLSRAAVAVCPTRVGTGLQTKILEAIACGTPVVATPKALAGLPQDLRPVISAAQTAEAFAAAVVRLLRSPETGRNQAETALRMVSQFHTWTQSTAALVGCYEEAVRRSRFRHPSE